MCIRDRPTVTQPPGLKIAVCRFSWKKNVPCSPVNRQMLCHMAPGAHTWLLTCFGASRRPEARTEPSCRTLRLTVWDAPARALHSGQAAFSTWIISLALISAADTCSLRPCRSTSDERWCNNASVRSSCALRIRSPENCGQVGAAEAPA